MARYRSRPAEIEATLWKGGDQELPGVERDALGRAFVVTIHGQPVYLEPGVYIATEPDGVHHYPIQPDIFRRRWEPIES